jgi:hypothetical protein
MRFLALFFSIVLLVPSVSIAGDRGVLGILPPLDPTDPGQRTAPSLQFTGGCYCFTHGRYEPCVRQVRLLGLKDEDCPPRLACHAGTRRVSTRTS